MSFEDLPNELLVQILKCVPDASHCRVVSKRFNDIIIDIEHRVFKNPNKYIEELSAPVYFLLKDDKYRKLIWDKAIVKGILQLVITISESGYKFDPNDGILIASKEGHKELVNFFIGKGANCWDRAMIYATQGGHKDLVEFFIEKGANNWNDRINYAAQAGYTDVVDFFTEKTINTWNLGMELAAKGGYKDLVEFFIEKCATARE